MAIITEKDISLDLIYAEYEARVTNLKSLFIQGFSQSTDNSESIQQQYSDELQKIRKFITANRSHLDLKNLSSLFAVPTKKLAEYEMYFHRIWMGGSVPQLTRDAITQWEMAVDTLGDSTYASILWVWDKAQMSNTEEFAATGGESEFTLGSYTINGYTQHVNSLQKLAQKFCSANYKTIAALHTNKYYAALSDYFRFVILINFGGIYMDSDTLPYKAVTQFLVKPEVPDLIHHTENYAETAVEAYYLSWLNLFFDETGLIVAKKANPIHKEFHELMNANYRKIPEQIETGNQEFEVEVFGCLYDRWKQHIGRTFMSHDEFYQKYSVLWNGEKEEVLCGIKGMRLLLDFISDTRFPLTPEEVESYNYCIDNLNDCGWKLDSPFDLERHAQIFSQVEVPRMAYSPQFRSEHKFYHYYNFLCEDKNVDRVNSLFEKYFAARNNRDIAAGNFWFEVRGSNQGNAEKKDSERKCTRPLVSRAPIQFKPGSSLAQADLRKMAKLIFETSYLEFCSVENTLHLELTSLQQKQNIEPFLDLLQGVFTSNNDFVGFVTSGLSKDFDTIDTPYYYRDAMRHIDDAYNAFVAKNLTPEDYFLCTVALEKAYRGKGIFNQIFNHIHQQAEARAAARIVLTVYENNPAFKVYLNKGFTVVDTFDYVYDLFYDRVKLLEYKLG